MSTVDGVKRLRLLTQVFRHKQLQQDLVRPASLSSIHTRSSRSFTSRAQGRKDCYTRKEMLLGSGCSLHGSVALDSFDFEGSTKLPA